MKLPDPEFLIPGAPVPAHVLDGGRVSVMLRASDTTRLEGVTDETAKKDSLEWKIYEFLKPYVETGLAEAGMCTIAFICHGLNNDHSSGAVNSVLSRWGEKGFALVEPKPTRFLGYTEAGTELGLAKFKALKR